MSKIKFGLNKNNHDSRSDFANDVCELLIKAYGGDVIKTVESKMLTNMRQHFENHVRNIYELDDEIPLFALHQLKQNNASNFGWTEDEYNNEIENTIFICKGFYINAR